MTNQRPDLLTPEERELADRLGRIAPRGAPSAALDARILGAAHAAAGRKASPARPRSRWPALVGIAATVALALGVVWQLRPARELPTVRDEVPSSAVMRPQAATAVSKEARPDRENAARGVAESQSGAADIAAPQPAEPRARVSSRPSPLPPPPVVFDDPSPIDAPESAPVPAPPAPPPPPPPLPAPTSAPATNSPAPDTAQSRRYKAAPMAARMQRKATEAAAMESAANDAMADTAIRADERSVTIADVPVDSDRMLTPVDWIERIRQRRDTGDLDGARASLDALRQTHPTVALPEDVVAIATPSATLPER